MAGPETPDIPCYRVTLYDPALLGDRVETFDQLEVALAYLRSKVQWNGAERVVLETVSLSPLRYAAEVEEQEAAYLKNT